MTILIIGTPDSGKSQKAEALAVELGSAAGHKKYYIATMIPYGEEGAKRVEKHRNLRAGKGFETIEKTTAVHELVTTVPDLKDSTCLLECMSNLIGNEMHEDRPEVRSLPLETMADAIARSVMTLAEAAGDLVIVSNRFPTEDPAYDEDTRNYVSLVDLVNKELAEKADRVFELRDGLFEQTK
ncbi:MAG: bifunctional adenosylcobinamide kinase/adenosylcobinamide-phosphate guanylyltransferase [Lachnospiraceae bacterium]|nr:bifunctional adenosylcobinamide kinase/adenosylcobinamide-phosphate guanylyltransferase [Lachnospiraceae bacterium]